MSAQEDSARAALLHALDQIEVRVDSATNGLVRCVCGGLSFWHERVRRYRAELARAVEDLDAVTRALTALDQIDAECGREPGGLP